MMAGVAKALLGPLEASATPYASGMGGARSRTARHRHVCWW
jgi:hypothetical protein